MQFTVYVPTHLDLEQKVEGLQYVGTITIASVTFSIDVALAAPIHELGDLPGHATIADYRPIYQIAIRHKDADIALTDEEYACFFDLIVPAVFNFFFFLEKLELNRGTRVDTGPDCDERVTRRFRKYQNHGFDEETCKLLSAPKFGCDLIFG